MQRSPMWCTHRSKHTVIQVVQVKEVFNELNVGHRNIDIPGGGVSYFLPSNWALPLTHMNLFTLMLLILFRMADAIDNESHVSAGTVGGWVLRSGTFFRFGLPNSRLEWSVYRRQNGPSPPNGLSSITTLCTAATLADRQA